MSTPDPPVDPWEMRDDDIVDREVAALQQVARAMTAAAAVLGPRSELSALFVRKADRLRECVTRRPT